MTGGGVDVFFLEISSQKSHDKNYAWLTVVVLSHGRRVGGVDEVLGVDGKGIDRREVCFNQTHYFPYYHLPQIVGKFTDINTCPSLQFKPKMFFFQVSCKLSESLRVTHDTYIQCDILGRFSPDICNGKCLDVFLFRPAGGERRWSRSAPACPTRRTPTPTS